ncbi:nucleotide exchange factor Fes1-domain-containing protein [Collybia nuda]|uniref:Nucleotide exchange factor Fes1-domain-containing protein n=1 Tax=Collybia nuda TaxID=64659 RepID=A0A9P5XW31_9AGAR|nr:nucleotide exchange factor Fes1-domain-containing protein [Collybia nuda]
MQSLLRWSIENSEPLDGAAGDRPPATTKELDPGIIDMILGKPDSVLMKEDLAVAVDSNQPEDNRIAALDHLEMAKQLIEQIDNANNLEKLEMWEPLHFLLTSETSSPQIKTQVLWVIGTAVQNNPSAQDAYFKHTTNPLSTLVTFLIPSPSSTLQTRSKTIYTLSGLLKHNAPAVKELKSPNVDGWARFRDALQDPEITVRRKTMFLLGTLLLPTTPMSTAPASLPNLHTPTSPVAAAPIHDNSHAAHLHNPTRTSTSEITLDAVRDHGVVDAVISALTNPVPYGEDGDILDPDVDFEEKGIRFLHTYVVTSQGELFQSEKFSLKAWLTGEKDKNGQQSLLEKWSLDSTEFEDLISRLA